MFKLVQFGRLKAVSRLSRFRLGNAIPTNLNHRLFSGFLSDKDFLDASAIAAAGPPTSVATKEPTAAPIVPVAYVSIKLGVQLAKYATDLTKQAANGELEKVIGREDEIQQAIQILSRRRKNNPCLIGEPGVGKSHGTLNLSGAT